MSYASLAAYDRILPELPAREQAVLQILLAQPYGLTNRKIGKLLGLERDSISPRTASLRQKGLIFEAGIEGKETIYQFVTNPVLQKTKKLKAPRLKGTVISKTINIVHNEFEIVIRSASWGRAEELAKVGEEIELEFVK